METMTIHRALAELKLIDSKIYKLVNSLTPLGLYQKDKLVNGVSQIEDFETDAKSKYQSINDLIGRKVKIKSAVVDANSKTEVKVNNKTMTISEAINYKTIIDQKRQLRDRLKSFHSQSVQKLESNNETVNQNALRLAESALQKDNVKINDGDAIAITEPYIKKNEFHLADPLKISELIDEMTEEIDNFSSEIDSVLSEINAITIIKI